jgi:hypothetical protein
MPEKKLLLLLQQQTKYKLIPVGSHTLQTHHIQFCISIFNTLAVC